MSSENEHASPWIVNATAATFEQDVFERSREVPVVVDFWAPWCAPCRALGPVLEKLAADHDGQFVLVKANTDELPGPATQFNVQGIPAVYGVVDGEVVDFFTGALPENHVKVWIDRLCLSSLLAEAKRLEEISPSAAEAKYRLVIDQTAENDAAPRIGLARVLLAQDRIEECRAIVQQLEERGFLEPEAEKIKAALELQQLGSVSVEQRRAAADADPDNRELSYQLAEALAGAEQYEEALERCLAIVQQGKTGIGEQARQLMVDMFRVLPEDSELTRTFRRKLSMAMY